MQKIDRLGWADGRSIIAYGLRVGIRTNSPGMLDSLVPRLPVGWKPSRSPDVQQLYSLIVGGDSARPSVRRFNVLYANAARVARSMVLDEVLASFESDLRLFVGERAQRRVFVHAGVVGWRGRAIVIPGHSFSGKTTLVRALCGRGATYYSDEFAAFDARGRVHPFPTPLGIRTEGKIQSERCSPETLGVRVGGKPLPVGLVAVTRFKDGARWRPRRLTAGASVLALLANTVPARWRPTVAMASLGQVAASALVLKGVRGEAEEISGSLLEMLDAASGAVGDNE
jgi:hypothetical protein